MAYKNAGIRTFTKDRHDTSKIMMAPEDTQGEIMENLNPEMTLFYQEAMDWSKTIGLPKRALKAGDVSPFFLLPDENGRLVSSQELLQAGPLILGFFLGSWSPFCVAGLEALCDAIPVFRSHGAGVAAVSPETADFPRVLKRGHSLNLTLLSDVDHGLGLSFGVVFSVPETMKTCLLKCGLDLPVRHGSPDWILSIPATYVIDQSGVISAAFIYHDLTVRPDPGTIIERLEALEAPSGLVN